MTVVKSEREVGKISYGAVRGKSSLYALYRALFLVSGINSLDLFVTLVLVPVPPFSTHLFLHSSLFPLLIHYSAHP